MLMRLDMPGLHFPDLDLQFNRSLGVLRFQGAPLESMLAWNGRPAALLDGVPDEQVQWLLATLYTDWRSRGGEADAAMEAALAQGTPLQMRRMDAPSAPWLTRFRTALQAWIAGNDRGGWADA